ncbi:MAG: cbb3-type cytochrome c oxidase N-terminal domain-containing protein [Ignavibacteria bacterium]
MKNKFSLMLLSIITFVLVTAPLMAQTTTVVVEDTDMTNYYIILFAVFFLLLNAIFVPLLKESPNYGESTNALEPRKSILKGIYDKISGLKPISQERELMMDEDYDGITELDNNVPPWFNILFYGTIVFAFVYILNYHVLGFGSLPLQEYTDEVTAANFKREELIRTGAFINENSVVLLTDKAALDNGKQIFLANCVPCHGNNGEGTVGPNLTDQFWIHGGGIKNVFKTLKYGVPAKGMIAWQNQFNPKSMQEVGSYVLSLQGTNPPNGKAPEGPLYVEAAADSLKTGKDTLKSKMDSLKVGGVKKDSAMSKEGAAKDSAK